MELPIMRDFNIDLLKDDCRKPSHEYLHCLLIFLYANYSVSQNRMVHVEMRHFDQYLFNIFHSILHDRQDY